MSTLILHHDDCLRHEPVAHHPERPERVGAVLNALKPLKGLEFLPAPRASEEQVLRVHDDAWWNTILDTDPGNSKIALDPDTWLSAGTVDATLRGSGAICFALDQLMQNKADNAFCAIRPPGHHAGKDFVMGFCVLNHVAVAAQHARVHHGIERIAILDFDVHHGNGSQAMFENDPNTLFISSHQYPFYPGTGQASETGCGNVMNLPLDAGDGSAEFRSAWKEHAFPMLNRFKPELILVSAGFDGHAADPLGGLNLVDDDFEWIGANIMDHADALCAGRMISLLEGGYDLESLGTASTRFVSRLIR